ncbi:MAG TPA: phage holin family protein [Firmicutes bacterium]|nr:phage holin family protein [Bacillota bacterium]
MSYIFDFLVEEALILIPVLMIIGKILKDLVIFPDKWIPLFLLPLGILGAVGLIGPNIKGVIQGILVTGMAVYGNQLFKQIKRKT